MFAMIAACPECRRLVANNEPIAKTRAGWVPVWCCSDRQRVPVDGSEVVANCLYWYTSATDGTRYRLLSGPYRSYDTAQGMLPTAKRLALDTYPEAALCAFVVAWSNTVHATVFRSHGDRPELPPQAAAIASAPSAFDGIGDSDSTF